MLIAPLAETLKRALNALKPGDSSPQAQRLRIENVVILSELAGACAFSEPPLGNFWYSFCIPIALTTLKTATTGSKMPCIA